MDKYQEHLLEVIADLHGIEHFSKMIRLNCSRNRLTDLDLRKNVELVSLDCSGNYLSSLDLCQNSNMVEVVADSNYREVLVPSDKIFDLTTLPRFELSRMEQLQGGTLQGSLLTFEQDEVRYFYNYNCPNPASPLGGYFCLRAIVDSSVIQDTTVFIAIDEEGGRVARIGRNSNFDVPRYDSMEAVGNTGDPQNAYEAGLAIGTYLQEYGLNVDFAPVADMNTNPNNVVIGDRAFGSDPQLVSDMVNAAIDGFHEAGIITSIKHFPGHGDTTGDTHDGYVAVTKSWEELKNCELIPFIAALDNTDMVMAAHITLPNITTDGLPASLSHEILTEKLRGELGYQGVIVTDSLSMGAIIQNYSPLESVKTAFLAGADILLMPRNFTEGFDGLVAAIETGEISEERLNESVLRILKLKIQYGIIDCT